MNQELIAVAKKVRGSAYAPHSGFSVGAAILGSDNRVYSGCNVENDSYGLSICAERNAVASMVANGCRTAIQIAIATEKGAPPCGACRQVLFQFAPTEGELEIFLIDASDTIRETTLSALFPDGFRL
jgi:cytidine deaminase